MELWRSSCPTPHSKQVVKSCIHSSFNYLQGWRLHNPSGQPAPVFNHPYNMGDIINHSLSVNHHTVKNNISIVMIEKEKKNLNTSEDVVYSA